MKSVNILAFTLCSALLLPACTNHAPAGEQIYGESTVKNRAEADVLGVVVTINKNEIAAAHLAEKRASHPAVRDYAVFLDKQHTQNLQQTMSLSHKLGVAPAMGRVAHSLEVKGQRELAKLSAQSNASFDKAYINAMVSGHAQALQLIDKLLKDSSNPWVIKHLQTTRSHVAMHLQKAQMIQKQLAR